MRGLLLGLSFAALASTAAAQETQPPPSETPAAAPAAAAERSALDALRVLYDMPAPPRTGLGRYFAPDIAEALERDLAQNMPAVSADYRFDAPQRPSGEVTFAEAPSERDAGYAVSFNGGRVLVELCRRRDGQWRVTDIRDPDDFWGTRAYLMLPGGHVRCDQ